MTSVEREALDMFSPVPLYRQLAELLAGQIERGELPSVKTGRMPSVQDLQQEFGVAQGTAEKAMALLRKRGLVRSAQGKGHYVVPEAERPPAGES